MHSVKTKIFIKATMFMLFMISLNCLWRPLCSATGSKFLYQLLRNQTESQAVRKSIHFDFDMFPRRFNCRKCQTEIVAGVLECFREGPFFLPHCIIHSVVLGNVGFWRLIFLSRGVGGWTTYSFSDCLSFTLSDLIYFVFVYLL